MTVQPTAQPTLRQLLADDAAAAVRLLLDSLPAGQRMATLAGSRALGLDFERMARSVVDRIDDRSLEVLVRALVDRLYGNLGAAGRWHDHIVDGPAYTQEELVVALAELSTAVGR